MMWSLNACELNLTWKILTPCYFFITQQNFLSLFIKCCDDLISKWEGMMSPNRSSEMDVMAFPSEFG